MHLVLSVGTGVHEDTPGPSALTPARFAIVGWSTRIVTDRRGWLEPPGLGRAEQPRPMDFTVNLFIAITVDRTNEGDRHVMVTERSHRLVYKAHALVIAIHGK